MWVNSLMNDPKVLHINDSLLGSKNKWPHKPSLEMWDVYPFKTGEWWNSFFTSHYASGCLLRKVSDAANEE